METETVRVTGLETPDTRYYYRPPMKLREGSVFSRACPSVSLSTGGPNVTITPWTSLLVTSGSHQLDNWKHVRTCSLEDLPPPQPDWY